jgi:hypothetical protein
VVPVASSAAPSVRRRRLFTVGDRKRWENSPAGIVGDHRWPPHPARHSLLIIELVPGQQFVLITVAAGGGPTVVTAVDLDVRRSPQDHLSFVARSITVMIKARVTHDLARLGRPTVIISPALCGASIISCLTTLRSGVGSESASRPVSRWGLAAAGSPARVGGPAQSRGR